MATNNHTKYDEDFKKSLVSSIKMEKNNRSSAKNTAFLNPLPANG